MLKLIGKLKKYIAEHYTGEEPFVESRRDFYVRLLQTQRDELLHGHFTSKESVSNECASDSDTDFAFNDCLDYVEEKKHSGSMMMRHHAFKRMDSLDELLHKKTVTFADKLNQLLCEKNLDAVYVYKRANIDRRLFSKLLRKDYKPGKNTILALIMAMQLTVAEARELLSYAGYGLAPNNKTDIIIGFFLENEIYDMDRVNEMLYLYGEKCLGNLSA